jgi:hypothetical protein
MLSMVTMLMTIVMTGDGDSDDDYDDEHSGDNAGDGMLSWAASYGHENNSEHYLGSFFL